MNDENFIAFEKWASDEMDFSVHFISRHRKQNAIGGVYYDHIEIHKRYRAWCAALKHKNNIPW